ncbi:hypothetical protein D3C71_1620780 [compost metagenome]
MFGPDRTATGVADHFFASVIAMKRFGALIDSGSAFRRFVDHAVHHPVRIGLRVVTAVYGGRLGEGEMRSHFFFLPPLEGKAALNQCIVLALKRSDIIFR